MNRIARTDKDAAVALACTLWWLDEPKSSSGRREEAQTSLRKADRSLVTSAATNGNDRANPGLKAKEYSGPNYHQIQLFHSALNPMDRAGFLMANSASDARASEQKIRQRPIESRVVEGTVAVRHRVQPVMNAELTLIILPHTLACHA